MRIFIFLTLCFLFALPVLAEKPYVHGAYFTANNVLPPTPEDIEAARNALRVIQEYYKNGMIKHGYSKEFQLKKADNKVDIRTITGKEPWKKYSANLRLIRDEVNTEFGYKVSEGGETIIVVFLPHIKRLPGNLAGLHIPDCSDDFICKNVVLIPGKSKHLLQVTAHELGHAFGLHHAQSKEFLMHKSVRNKALDELGLSEDEARWLDCTKFFNDQETPKSVLNIVGVQEPQWLNKDRTLWLGFDIESEVPLHQVYLLRGGVVLSYYYANACRQTVWFKTRISSTTRSIDVAVKMLDQHGNANFHAYHFSRIDPTVRRKPVVFGAPSMPFKKAIVTWGDIKTHR